MKAIIFDLDGTLWETVESSWNSYNKIVAKYPFLQPISKQTVAASMGTTVEECAELYMPYLDNDTRVTILMEMLEQTAKDLDICGGNVYKNVEDTLKELKENYLLGIVSNCGPGYIESFLHTSGLNKYFVDYIAAGAEKMSKGNSILRFMRRNGIEEAIYVGDTIRDYTASIAASIPFIHAKYGFDQQLTVDKTIYDINELPILLSKINAN